ncbi:hypothetical protein Tco_1273816 [Tanacetum coccineum]
MSDSEHSTVTYTSVSEDDLYMGSPGTSKWYRFMRDLHQLDYVPGPEGAKSRHHFTVSNTIVSREDDEEDPEEDPADYPADRGDDDDEHLAPADPASLLLIHGPGPIHCFTRHGCRMSSEPKAPTLSSPRKLLREY